MGLWIIGNIAAHKHISQKRTHGVYSLEPVINILKIKLSNHINLDLVVKEKISYILIVSLRKKKFNHSNNVVKI